MFVTAPDGGKLDIGGFAAANLTAGYVPGLAGVYQDKVRRDNAIGYRPPSLLTLIQGPSGLHKAVVPGKTWFKIPDESVRKHGKGFIIKDSATYIWTMPDGNSITLRSEDIAYTSIDWFDAGEGLAMYGVSVLVQDYNLPGFVAWGIISEAQATNAGNPSAPVPPPSQDAVAGFGSSVSKLTTLLLVAIAGYLIFKVAD